MLTSSHFPTWSWLLWSSYQVGVTWEVVGVPGVPACNYGWWFPNSFSVCRNLTCIPKNSASTTCVCRMDIDEPVQTDRYQMELWAGQRQLWHGSFKPSDNGKAMWVPPCGRWGPHCLQVSCWLVACLQCGRLPSLYLESLQQSPPQACSHKVLFCVRFCIVEDGTHDFPDARPMSYLPLS